MNKKILLRYLCLAVLGIAGCDDREPPSSPEPQPQPLPPPPPAGPVLDPHAQVPLNLIRVLHDGTHYILRDQPGWTRNFGCRLNTVSICSYCGQAASVYPGLAGIDLIWEPAQIKEFWANLIIGVPMTYDIRVDRTTSHFLWFELYDDNNYYDDTKLNIFFGGNYSSDADKDFVPDPAPPGDELELIGGAIDPLREYMGTDWPGMGRLYFRQHIFINDQGRNDGLPLCVLSDHVLEHELGHYFLRRADAPGYDAGEHTDTLVDGKPHLMRREAPAGNRVTPFEQYLMWMQAKYFRCPLASEQCVP